MTTTNERIRNLAERALALSRNDIASAVEIMREMTGLSFEAACAAVENAAGARRSAAAALRRSN